MSSSSDECASRVWFLYQLCDGSFCKVSSCSLTAKCTSSQLATQHPPNLTLSEWSWFKCLHYLACCLLLFLQGMDWTVELKTDISMNLKFKKVMKKSLESSWNVKTHGDARVGKWQMEWVASTLHTTSEHGVSSITTADAHTSAAISWLKWRPHRFKWTLPFRRKTKFCFCTCAVTFEMQFTAKWRTFATVPILH